MIKNGRFIGDPDIPVKIVVFTLLYEIGYTNRTVIYAKPRVHTVFNTIPFVKLGRQAYVCIFSV